MAMMIADVVGRDGITKELAISLLLDGVTGSLAAQGAFALQLSPLLLDETRLPCCRPGCAMSTAMAKRP